jgi:hypothetical protein
MSTTARRALAALPLILALSAPSSALALTDASGATIANTGAPEAQLAGDSIFRLLLTPENPARDSAAALAALGSPGSAEDDLGTALDTLASAPNPTIASSARTLALNILEGNQIAGKAYSGIPLLNWNSPAKIKTVPAGGNVTVNEVRFGEHAISDTWMLRFADPSQPFTITYRIAELGLTGIGGVLAPTPLLADDNGTPLGGQNSILQPLTIPDQHTNTSQTSPFHPTGAAENTRLAQQDITVRMPPAHLINAILDPDLAPGHGATMTLQPATPERIAAAANNMGFNTTTPNETQKLAAISKLGDRAPEKILWADLRNLDPTNLTDAHTLGSDDRPLSYELQTRSQPPAGVNPGPTSDINIVLLNNETYAWGGPNTYQPGGTLTITITNADNFTHNTSATTLTDKQPFGQPLHGANTLDYGQFNWANLNLNGPTTLAPGETHTYTTTPNPKTFAISTGDPTSGDQTTTLCQTTPNNPITCPTNNTPPLRTLTRTANPLTTRTTKPTSKSTGSASTPGRGGATLKSSSTSEALAACRSHSWLARSGRQLRVALMDWTPDQVKACLGKPASSKITGKIMRWGYGRGSKITFVNNHVVAFKLKRDLLTAKNSVSASSTRNVLRLMHYNRRTHTSRALVKQDGMSIKIRLTRTSRKPIRITSLTATRQS